MMPRVPTAVWGQSPGTHAPGLARMHEDLGRVWAHWDSARQHVSGIITSEVDAPGTVDSPARAKTAAQGFLTRYIDILAPGLSASNFVVVGNQLSSGIRTVGFAQHIDGVPVIGGQLSFHFKADRLIYMSSQALPGVDTALTNGGDIVGPAWALDSAQAWVGADYPNASISASNAEGPYILPLWDGQRWSYRDVVRVRVDSTNPLGSWTVYLDATSGDPVAREQRMHSAATVQYNVPVRRPGGTRYDATAARVQVSEGGAASVTDVNGQVELNNSPANLTTTVNGPLVNVNNDAGSDATNTASVSNGGTLVWNASNNEFADAQVTTFIHTSLVKEYVRNIDPGLGWIDNTIQATVNINDVCNAMSDGDSIFFFRSSAQCGNTARLPDVVYHEVGHSVHSQSIIPGAGAFEGALSEGISDYLAATMVDDSGMGRGFFKTNDPLRELDPPDFEWRWPQDKGAVHDEGRIIGGTLWDLREALRASLGDEAGIAQADIIWYEGTRRSIDIPSMYPAALLADDDDGNISNGTPNVCEINAAFEAHGLLDPAGIGAFDVDFSQVQQGAQVIVSAATLPSFQDCPIELAEAELSWRIRGDAGAGTNVAMALENGAWVADVPNQELGTVIEYQVRLTDSEGRELEFPRNRADPWYQAFFGAAQPIYCLDGDSDLGEWTLGSNWSFGPLGEGGVDPAEPYDSDGVLLSQDGAYTPDTNSSATSPAIDVAGFEDVRLHFRRWLTVEDGFYDQAVLYGNGETIWSNVVTNGGTTHHVDHEWRFQDIPLSDIVTDDEVTLSFNLMSDQGLEFGGWTADSLCVVEIVEAVCGDGKVTGDEECDDGNTEDGDGCDAQCIMEELPPGTSDGGSDSGDDGADAGTGGGGDDSALTDGDGSSNGGLDGTGGESGGSGQNDDSDDGGCGCTTGSSGHPLKGAWLLLLGLGWVRRRRRN